MHPRFSRRSGLAAALAGPLALAACGRHTVDPPANVTQAQIDEAMDKPTELNFWTWVPGIEKEVELFHQAYPKVKVDVVNAGQGNPHYAKLRTALRAGNGAPDIAQLEYQMIQSFVITDDLLDLAPYGAKDIGDQFVEFAWSQVSGANGEVWAIPQDTGPMGMLYREDIFQAHGIDVPATWDDFAAAAAALRAADPEVYLTNFAPSQGAFFAAMLWQAGADPFGGSEGPDLNVDLTSPEAEKVARYWGDLSEQDLIAVDADFNDQWYQALNKGKYATWVAPAWAPTFLQSAAASTSGLWRVAPLPQWEAGQQVSSNWGGSTSAVMATTRNPIAAAVFAQFINTDPKSTATMANEQFLYPPAKAILDDPAFTGQQLEFYGGQEVNGLFAQIGESVHPDFQWAPFQDKVYADFTATVGTAVAEKTDAVAAMEAWQQRTEEYAKYQGFTVRRP
ncbi:ABC transporter substrate-binding protein [Glycomyces niveus]|uniref:Extracellular solute-binding protein n=1 Tax=Glycomyces niveus TaxID=2820287 RepID=A0ABS3UBK9_9ACTN|nr:extracellular solute-binding protein [Glycomyces sp. NEAU-S30]MBO3735092.1 extracellular solute-binding protein [Glycomyces sp. NEAU-S30]